MCKLSTAATIAVLALAATASQAQELTINGGFETGDFTGWTQFPTGAGQQLVTTANPASGMYAGEIYNDVVTSNSLIKQANIGVGTVTPGMVIKISFDARGTYATPGGVAFAEFFSEIAGGGVSKSEILGGAPLALNADANVWKHFTYSTTAGSNVTGGVTLQLGATNSPDAAGTHIFYDSVSVQAVPEPATMLVLGLGAIAFIRRKRSS
jgi:hypothetical protein